MAVAPIVVQAPGRVNLIGEHTDYNDGYVMPIAIDRYTAVQATPRADDRIIVSSEGFGPSIGFALRAPRDKTPDAIPDSDAWGRYVQAVVWALQDAGNALQGCSLRIRSSVPSGAGLSSSAALEVACGFALMMLAGIEPDRTALALLCQRAENEYVGARCGIMDQYIACHGRAGHALLLDCRRLEHSHVPLRFTDSDTRIVVCNSMVRHSLAGGEYNRRREQCEAGVRHLAMRRAEIKALRDLSMAEFDVLATDMEPLIKQRCRHVIGENERVQSAAAAISRGDAAAFGQLMYASHASLRDDFEVSCAELDLLVDLAGNIDGVYGARMTGAGFGGCTVNLVRSDAVDRFERSIAEPFADATGKTPQIFVCRASEGVARMTSIPGGAV
jgi:galactokinase